MSQYNITNQPTKISALPSTLRIIHLQIKYQLILLLRTPRTIFSLFLLPVLLVVVFGLSGAGKSPEQMTFLVTGIASWTIVSTAYVTHAVGLVSARDRGVLKRLRGMPLPYWVYFCGRITATTLLSFLGVAATIIVALLTAHFTVPLRAIPGLVLGTTIGSICWAALGTAITRLITDTGGAFAILQATFLPLLLLSGVLFQVNVPGLTPILQWFPLKPLADALLKSFQSTSGFNIINIKDMLILLIWGVAGLLVALHTFRWEKPVSTQSAKGK